MLECFQPAAQLVLDCPDPWAPCRRRGHALRHHRAPQAAVAAHTSVLRALCCCHSLVLADCLPLCKGPSLAPFQGEPNKHRACICVARHCIAGIVHVLLHVYALCWEAMTPLVLSILHSEQWAAWLCCFTCSLCSPRLLYVLLCVERLDISCCGLREDGKVTLRFMSKAGRVNSPGAVVGTVRNLVSPRASGTVGRRVGPGCCRGQPGGCRLRPARRGRAGGARQEGRTRGMIPASEVLNISAAAV